jgi:DNA polymerase-3 subunit delta'
MNGPHPWNEELTAHLAHDLDRLPHAQLFAGKAGLGKAAVAEWLANMLLCTTPRSGKPCGQCQNCTLFSAGTHPDLHVVQPEAVYKAEDGLFARYALRYPPENKGKDSKDSTVIRVDQIRALIEACQTRPQIATRKILILSPADRMNANAANSLLKLLEEPPPDSFLVLVASQPAHLPATIRSRCARIEFHAPDHVTARRWIETQALSGIDAGLLLQVAGGAPLAALAMAESGFFAKRAELHADLETILSGQSDPLTCAARWKSSGGEQCLSWFQGWLADLASIALGADGTRLRNPDLRARLQPLEKRLHLFRLFQFSDSVARSRQLLGGALDDQLILEDSLISWAELRIS